jgi:predicted ester cyclase
MKELVNAFPDLKFNIEEIVAERDLVVVRFLETGTHKGQFGPIPATDRSISMSG